MKLFVPIISKYSNRKKKTKREEFLDAMEEIIPWSYWVEMIRPYYFDNKRGRKPIGIETMLRMYLMQIWFNMSDEGIEDSIYDSYAMRSFMHIDFYEQQVPDATTLLKFRHMLEANKLGEKIFADVNNRLDKAGLMMHGGTIVDASLIAAQKSTKNQDGKRDTEMNQKIALLKEVEGKLAVSDPRIVQVMTSVMQSVIVRTGIHNSLGLNLNKNESYSFLYSMALAHEYGDNKSGMDFKVMRSLNDLNVDEFVEKIRN